MKQVRVLWQTLRSNVTFDTRSLALARIVLGFAMLSEIGTLLYWSDAFLSPNGLMPLEAVFAHSTYRSIFGINESLLFQQCILILTAIVSIFFILGIRARWCALLLIFLELSIEQRLYVSGSTSGIRIALLWMTFLPIDHTWSLQNRTKKFAPTLVCNGATVAVSLHILLIFMTASWYKSGAAWLDYTAVYKSLWIGGLSTWLGEYIRQFPNLTRVLTFLTTKIEWYAPMLLLLPFLQPYLRCLALLLLIGLVASFQFTLAINPFTYAIIAILLLFIPSSIWNLRQKKTIKKEEFYRSHLLTWIVPLAIILLLMWQNFWYIQLTPKTPDVINSVLLTTKYANQWSMFARNDHSYRFWPYVKGTATNGELIDPWKWYIGLVPDFSYTPDEPMVSKLSPGYRWEGYLSSVMMSSTFYSTYHPYFTQFLCTEYNAKHPDNPLVEVTFGMGYQEVLDINKFDTVVFADLYTQDCPL